MKSRDWLASGTFRALGPILALATLVHPGFAAADDDHSGWSLNFTPVLFLPTDEYGIGGGVDPEVKYTLDLGATRLSGGARVGGYYVKDRLAVIAMPTLRLLVPVGPVEPYAAFGLGYGWIPKAGNEDVATMSRLGFVVRFSESFAIGIEGAIQTIGGSNFRFGSFGSMVSFDL